MTEAKSYIQVGGNVHEGVVKVRAPDEKSAGGYVVQRLSPIAARTLADWLEDGVPDKMLMVSDGIRWSEHELSPSAVIKIASDLRNCAAQIETKNV